jgi:hypothetical protein
MSTFKLDLGAGDIADSISNLRISISQIQGEDILDDIVGKPVGRTQVEPLKFFKIEFDEGIVPEQGTNNSEISDNRRTCYFAFKVMYNMNSALVNPENGEEAFLCNAYFDESQTPVRETYKATFDEASKHYKSEAIYGEMMIREYGQQMEHFSFGPMSNPAHNEDAFYVENHCPPEEPGKVATQYTLQPGTGEIPNRMVRLES